ncbi:MAG: GNAT family N-acetyltransferase [Kiritimatiellia bacterium]
MTPEVEYLSDSRVDDALDQNIRDLLTTCFTKPQDVVFKTQRYFREPYPHRWVIRNAQEALIAHVGVHEKQVAAEGKAFRIGGICEVCVHPDRRGRGYVKLMLEHAHAWLSEHGVAFAVLFGNPLVYGSCGYVQIDNLVHGAEQEGWKPVKAMVHEVSVTSWPGGEVRLPGPTF